MGASAPYDDAADGGAADAAGLAGALVDAVFELEEAFDAVGVDVVGDRGAAEADGVVEDLDEGLAELFEFIFGEATGRAAGADAGAEEAFVGVDVADAGEQGLVEQGGLDGELAAAEEGGEGVGRDGEGLGAGRGEGFAFGEVAALEAAKAAGIDEAKLLAARKREAGVGVADDFGVGCGDEEAAGHAEVDDPLSVGGCVRLGF